LRLEYDDKQLWFGDTTGDEGKTGKVTVEPGGANALNEVKHQVPGATPRKNAWTGKQGGGEDKAWHTKQTVWTSRRVVGGTL